MKKYVPSADLFAIWLQESSSPMGKHFLHGLAEIPGGRDAIIDELRKLCRGHYVAPEITAKRLAELGAPQTAELIKSHIPGSKRARSGDFGEILATELSERILGFIVPIRRLRWKDGREMALRGDDVIAIYRDENGPITILKGESKSRAALTAAVVAEAAEALDRDNGRPSRHSVLFVADRLREEGNDDLAKQLEESVIQSFNRTPVQHLLFTLSGNSPAALLTAHLSTLLKGVRIRHAVGVRIKDHAAFINELFSEL